MPDDTPKPYTDEDIRELTASIPYMRLIPVGLYQDQALSKMASRFLATLADRDRKLAIAAEALREIAAFPPADGRTAKDWESCADQLQAIGQKAFLEIEQLTTPHDQ